MWSINFIVIRTGLPYGIGELETWPYSTQFAYLRSWTHVTFRPASVTERLTTCAMDNHRITHRFLGPCCLCPLADDKAPDFVEAAIYMATDGPHSGKWIATCAKGECRYLGKSYLH